MKKYIRTTMALARMLMVFCMAAAPMANIVTANSWKNRRVQQTKPNILAKINFSPKVNGFGFQNYGNEHQWQDDLNAGDMIRLFGAGAACMKGNTAQDCKLKAPAREWMMQNLEAMDEGHCEGMAVASLRFATNKPFKAKVSPAQFQAGAETPFNLALDPMIENYIAYYWITQTLEEIYNVREKSRKTTPVQVVTELINGFKAGKDTYPIAFWKYTNGNLSPGHAVTPFAVDDSGTFYRIHVYDNNFPGQTRYITVEKAGKQTWKYVAAANPNDPASLYTGNIDTKSLGICLLYTSPSPRDS